MESSNVFHVRDARQLRQVLCSAVLERFAFPMIEPLFHDYEYDNGKSAFIIRDNFVGDYEVTIKRVG